LSAPRAPARLAGWTLAGALGLAAALAIGGGVAGALRPGLPVAALALWGGPAALAATAIRRWRGWPRDLIAWSAAAVLGTTAALPAAWSGRIESRMTVAERQLDRLGGRVDPYLQFLLGRFGQVADSVGAIGAAPSE